MTKPNNLLEKARRTYHQINQYTGGIPAIFRSAIKSFYRARAPEAAASMSYYALFSLFPLLIIFITIASYFVRTEEAFEGVVAAINLALPISRDLIERNLRLVFTLRGPVGAAGLAGLLWSGTNVFSILSHNINHAWPKAKKLNFFRARFSALVMVFLLVTLLSMSLLSTTLLRILANIELTLGNETVVVDGSDFRTFLSQWMPWGVIFLAFIGLYHWVPSPHVPWSHAFWGALLASGAWNLLTYAFTWYLRSGLAGYELVYGSLSALIALMFWIYWSGWIALFGAHITSALGRYQKHNQTLSGGPAKVNQ